MEVALAVGLMVAAVWGLRWKHVAEDLMYALVKEMEKHGDDDSLEEVDR